MRRGLYPFIAGWIALSLVLMGGAASAVVHLLSSPASTFSLCIPKSQTVSGPVRSVANGTCSSGYSLVVGETIAMAPVVFSGSGTYVVPKGVRWLRAEVIGAGGAGATFSLPPAFVPSGGGGGALVVGLLPVGTCSTVSVTVGVGGHGTTGSGTAGGSSSVSVATACPGASLVAGGGGAAGGLAGGVGGTASYTGKAVYESEAPGQAGVANTVVGGTGFGGNNGGGSGGTTADHGSGGIGGGGNGSSTGDAIGNGGNGLVVLTPI